MTLNFVRFVREVTPYMRPRNRVGPHRRDPVDFGQAAGAEEIDLSNGIRPGIAGLMKAIMPDLARDGITINLGRRRARS